MLDSMNKFHTIHILDYTNSLYIAIKINNLVIMEANIFRSNIKLQYYYVLY